MKSLVSLALLAALAQARASFYEPIARYHQHTSIDASLGVSLSRTVQYEVVVSEGTANPDGAKERMVYLINGAFPGEQFTLDENDDVQVFVVNNASTPFTMHFHGIDQIGTPFSDGVPGVSQATIDPGGNFTYLWSALQYGFHHAHAHYRQYQDDGMMFPIYIRPSPTRERPFEQIAALASSESISVALEVDAMKAAEHESIPVMIMDWRHRTSDEILEIWEEARDEPLCVDSILINGQGSSVCPSADQLQVYADTHGYGNVTSKGCLYLSNSIVNPTAFDANVSAVPKDMWLDCETSGMSNNTLHTFTVDSSESQWASFSIVNAGGLWELKFSIDEHPMYVYAVEGEYVNVTEPVDIISVPSGVRFQVLVKLDKDPGSAYTVRVAANVVPQILSGYAILQYVSIDNTVTTEFKVPAEGYPSLPVSVAYMDYTGTALTTADGLTANATEFEPLTSSPYIPSKPPLPDGSDTNMSIETLFLDMSRPNATVWAANHTGLQPSLYENLSTPIIWDGVWQEVMQTLDNETGALSGTRLMAADSITAVDNGTIVDLIIRVPIGHPAHPVHKHYNKFWVVGQGMGDWNYSTVAEAYDAEPESFNFENPPLRDGFNTLATGTTSSWLALRYIAMNPGPDVLHCHISQHISGGMVAVIMEGMELMNIPAEYEAPGYTDGDENDC
ncbi:hypothetical protein FISHEDRAFT_52806 [Fistulina hepatica ATCC 64428]|nr:hypothetical protein FISHEDRAFT_52806 [Fistulina hepatica ATCC 64428]